MRKPSQWQLYLLGWLADPKTVLHYTKPERGHNWRYSGWQTVNGNCREVEDWDGRTCRSFLARGWLDEAPNTYGWVEAGKLYKLNAAGRAAAERYLDLGEWVDEDEWERAKSD